MGNLIPTVQLQQRLRNDPTSYERVPADLAQAQLILDRMADGELLAVMLLSHQASRSGLDSLHRTAHTSAYDAARKGIDAVLLAMGVRCSRTAGHLGTVKAAAAVLPPPPESRARNAQAFSRARLVRHEDEYPRAPQTSTVSLRERRFQTQNCVRLVVDCQTLLGIEPREDLIPTDERLARWQPPGSEAP